MERSRSHSHWISISVAVLKFGQLDYFKSYKHASQKYISSHVRIDNLRQFKLGKRLLNGIIGKTRFGPQGSSQLTGSISAGRKNLHRLNSESSSTVTRSAKTCSKVPGPVGVLTLRP